MKTRNMAFLVASHRFPNAVDLDQIKHTGYVKKYPELIDSLRSEKEQLSLSGFIETKHAVIRLIKFWVGDHLKKEDLHLENELHHYWKNKFIEFNPNDSLQNPIKLIEKMSDEMFNKSDYFVIKKLVLSPVNAEAPVAVTIRLFAPAANDTPPLIDEAVNIPVTFTLPLLSILIASILFVPNAITLVAGA